jgi:hypothetical protein
MLQPMTSSEPQKSFENYFICQCHHISPPGCGRSVTDFWGWDAHEAQLRCADEVDGDIWIWSTKRGPKPKFYVTTQTTANMEIFSFKEKSPWKSRESNPLPHDQ